MEFRLLVAALYHDINCGSFGHSIEWAIDRYTPYNHEKKTEWLKEKEKLSLLNIKPIFIEPAGLTRYDFAHKYNLDFERIQHFIEGKELFVINNRGIDLDNIDNVFRMGLSMGMTTDNIEAPIKLARHLRINKDYDNFIIDKEMVKYVDIWHKMRSNIYHKFIYNSEYMAFEYLLFELISRYTKHIEEEQISHLFHFTDEKLLWYFFERKDIQEVSNIARKLLLHEIPVTYSIIRSADFDKKNTLSDFNVLESLANEVGQKVTGTQKLSKDLQSNIYFHLTTDDRKTQRQVAIFVQEEEQIRKELIGADERYILIGILGKIALTDKAISVLTDKAIEVFGKHGYGNFMRVDFADQTSETKGTLF